MRCVGGGRDVSPDFAQLNEDAIGLDDDSEGIRQCGRWKRMHAKVRGTWE